MIASPVILKRLENKAEQKDERVQRKENKSVDQEKNSNTRVRDEGGDGITTLIPC